MTTSRPSVPHAPGTDLPLPALPVGGPGERVGPSSETTLSLVGGLVIVLACLAFFTLASATDADTWVPITVLFSITVISLPICHRLAGVPRDSRLFKILLVAFGLKMLFTGPRYALNEVYYAGEVDAARYDQAGDYFVQNVSEGNWSIAGSELEAFPSETKNVGLVVGVLYIIFGTTYFGGYLIFSWLSWLGLVFFFKAFRVAFPNAPPYRAAALIFFLPSMLFWPSSLGKDALMVFCIGLTTLGIARVVTGRRTARGLLWTAIGLLAIAQVRPHLVLVCIAALAASTLARSARTSAGGAAAFRLLLLAAIVPAFLFGLTRLDSLFGDSASGVAGLEENLDRTLAQTNIGGSAFEASSVRSPLDVPGSIITVIYRPFLFEATNGGVLIAALEGSLLIVMTAAAARWVWRIGPAMARSPMAAFCGAYVLIFVVAFSNIGNAGILARQRVQMFPLLMLLVAAAHEDFRLHGPEAAEPEAPQDPRRPLPARLERLST